MRAFRDFATKQLAEESGTPDDHAVNHRMRYLSAVSQVPEDVLEAMPEVSRDDMPQDSPQEYECGCVTTIHVTSRNTRQKPFEMRLAILCKNAACLLAHLR